MIDQKSGCLIQLEKGSHEASSLISKTFLFLWKRTLTPETSIATLLSQGSDDSLRGSFPQHSFKIERSPESRNEKERWLGFSLSTRVPQ
ncbi:hypothetical protein NPIL_176241 [Nephila pilipes]|uniref:Uncharacterized protein n=1 Tax=Nephila pilipes TaxID=299642 RepID=A0A8X6N453_NEPPI|nr:hypothetical protein NPIL_176241 [Nephila pilipes]